MNRVRNSLFCFLKKNGLPGKEAHNKNHQFLHFLQLSLIIIDRTGLINQANILKPSISGFISSIDD